MRYKKPDRKNAISILQSAEKDMNFTLSMEITEESCSTIVRNVYECFRMLGDALLLSEGVYAEDHITSINKLTTLNVKTLRPIHLLDNLRRLRHNINYYGYSPKLSEVEDVVSIAQNLFEPLLKEIKKRVNP